MLFYGSMCFMGVCASMYFSFEWQHNWLSLN